MASRPDSEFELVIRAARLVQAGTEMAATIGVRDGRIAAIGALGASFSAAREVEFGPDVVVLPGLVDTHVHVCDPGTDWEGFDTATKAAAAGGITTLVDMPIDSFPATLTPEALEAKRASARGRCHIDVGFWGGAVPENLGQLKPLSENGVLGFKCFLIDPGVPDYSPMSSEQMKEALASLRDLSVPLLVHAETPVGSAGLAPLNSRQYADYLASRPKEMENRAIAEVIDAARQTGGRAHVVHLSSADGVGMIEQARRDGVAVTVESCPHYLTLSAEQVPEGGTVFKCSPPIREETNREGLWKGLQDGVIDFVVSDHAPCTAEMKHQDSGNFGAAWGGISSLQLTLPIVWTEARRRGHSLPDIAKWMAEGPATFAGLGKKGRIAKGLDADFCIFAPDETFVVDPHKLYHRHPLTPYEGRTLSGAVRQTWLRGERVDLQSPHGRLLAREPTGAGRN
jgi:allantoinase